MLAELQGDVDPMAWTIVAPGRHPGIGPESGRLVREGISRHASPHGSVRYLYSVGGIPAAGLQVVTRDGRHATIANVYVAPAYRGRGLATRLLRRAERDFAEVAHAAEEHLSPAGRRWRERTTMPAAARLGDLGRTFKRGQRVRFCPSPSSLVLYSEPPAVGATGKITPVSVGRNQMVFLPGPGGGLVYVQWDDGSFQGVSSYDIVSEREQCPERVPVGPARPGQRFTHGDVEIQTELVDMYPAQLRGVRGLGDCSCQHAPAPRFGGTSMPYGQMPNFGVFQDAFDREMRGDYTMELNPTDWLMVEEHMAAAGYGARVVGQVKSPISSHFDKVKLAFDARGLYKLLQSIMQEYDSGRDYGGNDAAIREEMGSFVSAVLQTLGFEWV